MRGPNDADDVPARGARARAPRTKASSAQSGTRFGIVGTRRAKSPRKAIKVPRRHSQPVLLGLKSGPAVVSRALALFRAWQHGPAWPSPHRPPSPTRLKAFLTLIKPQIKSSWSQLSQNGIPIVLMMFWHEARLRLVQEHHQHNWDPIFNQLGSGGAQK